jgi:hypothetical protein
MKYQNNTSKFASRCQKLAAAALLSAGLGVTTSAFAQPLTFKDSQGKDVVFPQGAKSFADRVVSFKPGSPFTTDARAKDPQKTLGVPDLSADEYENYLALGKGGILTVEFTDNYLVNIPGPDLWIFEIGPAVEATDVAISKDGKNWIHVGRVAGATAGIDIGPKVKAGDKFSFVRLIDANNDVGEWPGADIDAIGAIGSVAREPQQPNQPIVQPQPNRPVIQNTTIQCKNQLRIEMKDGSVILVDLDKVERIVPVSK